MGKSTTASIFAKFGIPVWDADAAVHRLYAKNGAAVAPLHALHPAAIVDGMVDRPALKAWIAEDPHALAAIEAVVHPLVAADRAEFIATSTAKVILLDIPLLFETGGDQQVDMTVVVSVDPDTQRDRVLARGVMTDAEFKDILQRQMPDAEKRAKADHVIITDTLPHAEDQVRDILQLIEKEKCDA